MSQQEENTAQSASFYNSAQFPSPAPTAMAGQYSYPPPEGHGNSPSGSNMALPPLSLPPIRSIDGIAQPQQQQAQQSGQAPMGSAMAPAMGQYYGQGQPQPFPPTSDPNAPQRWPLPPDGRVMSGGRHKKEIKRRTKTGCLTCRKRRIKCDEAHPACKNCQKSKRECLGYDPIFKSQPGPTAIQPATGGAPPLQSGSIHTSPYTAPPPSGYPHASAQGYSHPGTHSENSTSQPYDYSAAIDPALEGGGAVQMQDSKGPTGTGSPYPQGEPDQEGHRAKRTKIEELLCLKGYSPPPPAPPTPVSAAMKDEIQQIWLAAYAPGIDKFLETRWFGMRGLTHLMENSRLCNQFSAIISRFSTVPDPADPNHYHHYYITQSLEATVVWAMMGMCRQVVSKSSSESSEIDELDIKEGVRDAAKRLEIFEALVTGEYLDAEPMKEEPDAESNGTALDNQLKTRERKFWSLVHTFLTKRDDEASSAKEIDDTLATCRGLLDSRENRDVIYSIMIARHVGGRMAEFPNNLQQPESNDEADNRNKLNVAKRFIEEQVIRGTNQVVQRLCGMAVRSWSLKR